MLNNCILRLKNRLLQAGVPRGIPLEQAVDYFEEHFFNRNINKITAKEKARELARNYLRNNPYCTVDDTDYVWHTDEIETFDIDEKISDQRIDDVKSGKSEVVPMENVFKEAGIEEGI